MALAQYLALQINGYVLQDLRQYWTWDDIIPLDRAADALSDPELRKLVTLRVHELAKIEVDSKRIITAQMMKILTTFLIREYTDEDRKADKEWKHRRNTQ